MGFNTRQEMDEDSDSGCDVTEAEIEILNKGKKLKYEVIWSNKLYSDWIILINWMK
mgnify:CR=1 FL=1